MDSAGKFNSDLEARFEAESLRNYGAPAIRNAKNQKYVAGLKHQYGEETIRGILKALSQLEEPMCAASLRDQDLTTEPIEKIIHQYEFGGMKFGITNSDGEIFTVEISVSLWMEGDGGTFLDAREAEQFRVIESLGGWIC